MSRLLKQFKPYIDIPFHVSRRPYSVANGWIFSWLRLLTWPIRWVWSIIKWPLRDTPHYIRVGLNAVAGIRGVYHLTRSWKLKLTIAVLVGFLILAYLPHKIIYAKPPSLGPVPTHEPIKTVKALPGAKLKPLRAVKAIYIAKPVVVQKPTYSATGGCVAGYSTSNYALNQIIAHESTGNSCATNAGGCFGLLQACPGYPLRAACGGNPSCQIQWFIDNKTGGRSWEQIWALWQTQGYW